MTREYLFRSRSLALRPGDAQDWVPDRTNGDEPRAMIHSLQNVMPRKILLVEEDPYYVEVIKEAMTEGAITVVGTWQAALRQLTHELYDLVLISVARSGDLDSIDMMRFQRETGEEKNFLTPFIAMIGEGYEWRTTEALRSGCMTAIQKPFTASMVRGMILEHFNSMPALWRGGQHS
jgi:DNA-binding NtrC family response regulator